MAKNYTLLQTERRVKAKTRGAKMSVAADLRKAADILRSRAGDIATLMTMEQGKPLAEAKGEVLAGADVIDWFAEEARRTYGQVIPARAEGVYQLVIKEPVGPVAAFTPAVAPQQRSVMGSGAEARFRPSAAVIGR